MLLFLWWTIERNRPLLVTAASDSRISPYNPRDWLVGRDFRRGAPFFDSGDDESTLASKDCIFPASIICNGSDRLQQGFIFVHGSNGFLFSQIPESNCRRLMSCGQMIAIVRKRNGCDSIVPIL
jgi:hypothetical protein